MADSRSTVRVSDRDRAILLQGKSDMITPEIVRRRHFPDGTADAVHSVLRRLYGHPPDYRYLQPQPLDDRRVYYCLTTDGARLLGISPKYAGPLKKQGKVKRYAVSWFIHADRPGKRVLFDPRAFPQDFPLHGHRLPRHPFYVDESAKRPKLGIILVDHNAHVRRTVHKTLNPLGRFLRHGWFDQFIRDRSFVVTVLTFSDYQRRSITQHLQHAVHEQLRYPLSRLTSNGDDRLPLELNVQVIPGMDAVLAYDQTREAKQ